MSIVQLRFSCDLLSNSFQI